MSPRQRRAPQPGRPTPGSDDPTIGQVAAFIQYVSRLALSDRLQARFAGAAALPSHSQLEALRWLAREGPLTYGDLAGRLRLDRTTVSRLAVHLLDAGLVTRDADPSDRRKAWLALTPAGAEALGAVEDVYLGYYTLAVSEWTPAQRAQVRDALALLEDGLRRLEIDDSGHAVRLVPRSA